MGKFETCPVESGMEIIQKDWSTFSIGSGPNTWFFIEFVVFAADYQWRIEILSVGLNGKTHNKQTIWRRSKKDLVKSMEGME